MRATAHELAAVDFSRMRWLAGGFIRHAPPSAWRHIGIGALQAYVREGEIEELRVHVWHPSLVKPGILESGNVHDHRFDLESTVVLGAVDHVEYELVEVRGREHWIDPGGRVVPESDQWRIHDVTHARLAATLTGSHHLPHPPSDRRYAASTERRTFVEGQSYFFPKRHFHCTLAGALAVTLVHKRAQEDEPPARVLSPVLQPVVHAFDSPLPVDSWKPLLALASLECLR